MEGQSQGGMVERIGFQPWVSANLKTRGEITPALLTLSVDQGSESILRRSNLSICYKLSEMKPKMKKEPTGGKRDSKTAFMETEGPI